MHTPAILKRMSLLQRFALFSLFGVVLSTGLSALAGYRVYGSGLLDICLIVSLFILTLKLLRNVTRKLLWRLRNRLLVTYVFVGVVPLFLVGAMITLTLWVILGQLAINVVRDDIDRRTDLAASAAHDLALSTLFGNQPSELVAGLMHDLPGMKAIVRLGEHSLDPSGESGMRDIPSWSTPGFKGLLFNDGVMSLAAHQKVEAAGRSATVFVYVPIDTALLEDFGPDLGNITLVSPQFNTPATTAGTKPNPIPTVVAETTRPLPPRQGFWDIRLPWITPLRPRLPDGSERIILLTVVSRPSTIVHLLFRSLGTGAAFVGGILAAVAAGFLVVEIISLIFSLGLTRSITRTVHDLYLGTRNVAQGDFSHRIPVRSKDQLSELAGSFNSMTERMQQLLAEVKEKEKIEAELEIAREVQTQLFPKGVPQLKTLELAGICKPARVVSGDYYDFVPVDRRWTAIVIGDISGKGISAALLMASMQSGLHAQISAFDSDRRVGEVAVAPSTAIMVGRLNRQLFESTSPGKYATFYCAVYDDESGRLSYTNAGHLPPILVRNGVSSRLEVNGMVVGIVPDTPYEQAVIQLQRGDLLAAFTDGITEAENEAGEQFGEERLARLLVENALKPLDEIVEITTRTAMEWAFDLANQDDTTMLLARRF